MSDLPPIKQLDKTVDYSDGTEDKLLKLFQDNPGRDEYDFMSEGQSWPITYHLSPRRKALVNWLDIPEGSDVLELGAGCGAITSHLATLPVKVTALEGASSRARTIAARLAGRENVEIVCGNITSFEPEKKFDVIFLVGVLEYAGSYVKHDSPYLYLLSLAGSWLKDDGCLVLAIENKFGHKYLAGLPEDHYGKPYVGVSGYPPNTPVRTFDRMELENLVLDAGFSNLAWFAPTPDYKLPDAVLSEKAFMFAGYDPLPLFDVPSSRQDEKPNFNELHFLRRMHKAGQCFGFMNSFMVLASRSGENKIISGAQKMLAITQNMDDCPKCFHTATKFTADENGIVVHRSYLHEQIPAKWELGSHQLKKKEKYFSGYRNLLELMVESLEDGQLSTMGELLLHWCRLVEQGAKPGTNEQWDVFQNFCADHLGQNIYPKQDSGLMVPGMLMDAHPGNALFNPTTGDSRLIDLEWKLKIHLPLQLVWDRGINRSAQEIKKWRPFYQESGSESQLFPAFMEPHLAGIPAMRKYTATDLIFFENWFRLAVRSGNMDVYLND